MKTNLTILFKIQDGKLSINLEAPIELVAQILMAGMVSLQVLLGVNAFHLGAKPPPEVHPNQPTVELPSHNAAPDRPDR
jgi:hypothetical protein